VKSIRFGKQLRNRHRFFGRNATGKGWREAMRGMFPAEIEMPHKERNGVL
jgi:hypothetical protein